MESGTGEKVFMKKFCLYIFAAVSLAMTFLFTADASGSYTIKSVNITAEPQPNGDASIMSEWTVEFGPSHSDGFECEIPVESGAEYEFSSVDGISADIDSSNVSLSAEALTDIDGGFADYTYTLSESESAVKVKWNLKCFGETHVFRLSYTLRSVIKNIDSQNVFYCNYIPESLSPKCAEVSITVKLPSDCTGKDVGLLTLNNYKCRRDENSVTFTGGKTAGGARIGISIPSDAFTSLPQFTTSPEGRTAGEIAAIVISCVAALALILCLVFSKRIMIKLFVRSCRKNSYVEPSDNAIEEAARSLTPAEMLKTVSTDIYSEADLFIYTVLSLAKKGTLILRKGVILPSGEGRNLKKHEKSAVEFFAGGNLKSSADFYRFINKFNKKVKGISPFSCLKKSKRELCRKCFETESTAETYDGIKISTISEDVFKPGKISDADLIRFMFRENNSKNHISDGLFAFREVYEDGFEEILKEKKRR